MIRDQFLLDIAPELIVDNFAGGGGASCGIELALGRHVDIAINHDPEAVAMHAMNHPQTDHHCESVWDVNPLAVTRGRPVGLAWFSPDCKHFSKAKGGKPRDKRIRGLAWVALRWAALARPRVIILENVEEFQTWGPLLADGNPCPRRRGDTFRSFVRQLREKGYAVEWRELRACDFGAPTIRKRLFLIARCDGQPVVWPEPTHGAPDSAAVKAKSLKPWRTAAECIDWSIKPPSIFERERPLAEATQRRIARGLRRYVINSADPFIVKVNHGGDDFRGQRLDEPIQTITGKHGYGLVAPILTECANASNQRSFRADDPLRTQCAEVKGGHFALASATLVQTGYGERPGQAPRAPGLDKPLGTVVAGGAKHALVAAFMAKHFTGVVGHVLPEPLHTVTATDHHALVTAHLEHMNGRNHSRIDPDRDGHHRGQRGWNDLEEAEHERDSACGTASLGNADKERLPDSAHLCVDDALRWRTPDVGCQADGTCRLDDDRPRLRPVDAVSGCRGRVSRRRKVRGRGWQICWQIKHKTGKNQLIFCQPKNLSV
ncbi:DNA cytosine methyltransferase [Ralstonia pseudosolanacearum]|uniref:DNA cytosine methyltransferase n=1 Tax=Ralstonia pseudosolanacearum TaxID=1310165 RepID=UPI000856E338|nr:DNA cytosine methyltransferase [Ralstonia pseudosolanacearum]AOE89688.1 DNA (cytosine-5-)-methyltransferase [Ralstonia solanacearum]NKA11956.1 type II restriction endonuclease subunit M [Ralstonia solanacearum]NKA47088.1 type II restriction endonuclease subunit M [Ralstonia solanacearum]UYR00906.1 DNA cytosine methyltransferase [Ralstonia pseudosolanacearum]UYR10365.1 DNA cytosine methyltransferase [Ralstonia pseudosolanacearum]